MKANELISNMEKNWPDFFLNRPINNDMAVVVKENGIEVFYFSIPPDLSDEEVEKQLTDYLSAKRKIGLLATIDSKPVIIGPKFPVNGL